MFWNVMKNYQVVIIPQIVTAINRYVYFGCHVSLWKTTLKYMYIYILIQNLDYLAYLNTIYIGMTRYIRKILRFSQTTLLWNDCLTMNLMSGHKYRRSHCLNQNVVLEGKRHKMLNFKYVSVSKLSEVPQNDGSFPDLPFIDKEADNLKLCF